MATVGAFRAVAGDDLRDASPIDPQRDRKSFACASSVSSDDAYVVGRRALLSGLLPIGSGCPRERT